MRIKLLEEKYALNDLLSDTIGLKILHQETGFVKRALLSFLS